MKKIIVLVGLVALLLVGGKFWAIKEDKVEQKGIKITTSFYPLYYLTREIGGNLVAVGNLTPSGAEPHDYELTSQDIVAIKESKLLVILGNLEPWEDKIEEIGGDFEVLKMGGGEADPHIWLSPRRMQKMADKILDSLISVDEVSANSYRENNKIVKDKLAQLDRDYQNGLQNCQGKVIVTSHDAFGYLAADYGLTQVAIAGLSPEEEPSIKRLAEIAKTVKEKQVTTIFFESLVSPKLAETVAAETRAKTVALNPIEGLTAEQEAKGENYLSLMRENLVNLREALGCQ